MENTDSNQFAGIFAMNIAPLPNGSFHPDDAGKDLDACGWIEFFSGACFHVERDRKSQQWICGGQFEPRNVWD